MIIFTKAKINIGLRVIEKRADGYHNLETVFYPVEWHDSVEVVKSDSLSFANTGIEVGGDWQSNLCVKAYQLLRNDFDLPPVSIHLHKNVPFGAGLGAGSANAAGVLSLLNTYFSLSLTSEQLVEYAAKLGSDCAFFIHNEPMFATGRGEILSPIKLELEGYNLLLVKPELGVSTAQAYAGIKPQKPLVSLHNVLSQPIDTWKSSVVNDFETVVFGIHPQIGKIKEQLYELGASYAAMSGSGSSVYGIFKHDIPTTSMFAMHTVWHGKM